MGADPQKGPNFCDYLGISSNAATFSVAFSVCSTVQCDTKRNEMEKKRRRPCDHGASTCHANNVNTAPKKLLETPGRSLCDCGYMCKESKTMLEWENSQSSWRCLHMAVGGSACAWRCAIAVFELSLRFVFAPSLRKARGTDLCPECCAAQKGHARSLVCRGGVMSLYFVLSVVLVAWILGGLENVM